MTKIDRVIIASNRPAELAKFYSNILNVEVDETQHSGIGTCSLYVEGAALVFISKNVIGVDANRNLHQLRFVVADPVTSYQAAIRSGARSMDPPERHGDRTSCSLVDPEGNSFELADG